MLRKRAGTHGRCHVDLGWELHGIGYLGRVVPTYWIVPLINRIPVFHEIRALACQVSEAAFVLLVVQIVVLSGCLMGLLIRFDLSQLLNSLQLIDRSRRVLTASTHRLTMIQMILSKTSRRLVRIRLRSRLLQ